MIGKFLVKVAEATLVHATAAVTAKAVEKGITKVAANMPAMPKRGAKTEPSTKTEQDFEDLD